MDYLSDISTHRQGKQQVCWEERKVSSLQLRCVSFAFSPFPMVNGTAWIMNPRDEHFIFSKWDCATSIGLN